MGAVCERSSAVAAKLFFERTEGIFAYYVEGASAVGSWREPAADDASVNSNEQSGAALSSGSGCISWEKNKTAMDA